jgi:serine/threonine-protein kinase
VVAVVAGILIFSPSAGVPVTPAAIPAAAVPAVAQVPVAIGDAHTVDPCALVETASLARFGEVDLSTDSGNFNRCDLLVQPAGRLIGDVKVALANGTPDPSSQLRITRVGSVTIYSEPVIGTTCDRTLALADGNQIDITGRKDERTGPDPCALADAATDHAVDVLNRGPIPRRPAPLQAASLAVVDACGLLDGSALRDVPGVDALHPMPGFGNWSCRWNSTVDNGGVDVFFDRNPPLTADDGQPVKLGGLPSFVTPEFDGPHDCTVRVQYRPYTNITGSQMVELVAVKLFGSQPTKQRCATARALATAAVAKLPR